MSPVRIREAVPADLPALARLHVATWNATYPYARNPPTVELRERQWRDGFARAGDDGWFCFVAETADGLVGFAQGNAYAEPDQPDFAGQLNKIYLLGEYQGHGLGRRLVGHVARRFLARGITSMLVFGDPGNRSCGLYRALGGTPLVDPHGRAAECNFGWRDLRALADRCPIG